MTRNIEESVTYLMDRLAIQDVVATYSRGVDRLDKELVISTYHSDAVDDHAMFVGGPDEFWEWVNQMHSTFHTSTHHFLGNHLAEIHGNDAHAETYFIWSGMNVAGAPFSQIGGRYVDRLEKREGKWAIVARNCITDWAAPSINTIAGAQTPEGQTNYQFLKPYQFEVISTGPKFTRDKADPSYARPLTVPEQRHREYADCKQKAEESAIEEARDRS